MKYFTPSRSAGIAATVLAAICAAPAFANTGTVTVNGAIAATTCPTVLINGSASNTVTLPTVAAGLLAGMGTAGDTAFSIGVTGCTLGPATKMDIFFTPSSFNASGRVSKTSGTSSNVELELLRSDHTTIIQGNQAFGSQYTGQSTGTGAAEFSGNAATQNFWARYKGTGTITPGTFQTSFAFTIAYY